MLLAWNMPMLQNGRPNVPPEPVHGRGGHDIRRCGGGSEDVLRRHTENPSSAKNLYAARNEFPPSRISEPAVERL